ncbi:hypothetical protein HDU87_005522 [Geranomyces variabilis]|uniref:3'-5' exonuclease n=1 Tax=Geranomyces variabilis TaxID=109894 RepID=A0AAD5TGU2_9FUNG|nr:hypothetical protein HDU87_005522 [Geranomyces variabilis]
MLYPPHVARCCGQVGIPRPPHGWRALRRAVLPRSPRACCGGLAAVSVRPLSQLSAAACGSSEPVGEGRNEDAVALPPAPKIPLPPPPRPQPPLQFHLALSSATTAASSPRRHRQSKPQLHLQADVLAPKLVRALARANITPHTSNPYPIYVLDDVNTATQLLKIINRASGTPPRNCIRVVGLDCETAVRNAIPNGPPSMLQIAFANELVVIFQIYRMCAINGAFNPLLLPPLLKALLESPAVIKTGVGITGDIAALKRHYRIMHPAAIIDTSTIVRSFGCGRMSLASMFTAYCGDGSEPPLNKTRPSGASYMWDTGPGEIGINAVLYAANDAAASLKVYKGMFRRPYGRRGAGRELDAEDHDEEEVGQVDPGGGGNGAGDTYDDGLPHSASSSSSSIPQLPNPPEAEAMPPPPTTGNETSPPPRQGSLRTVKLPSGQRHDRSAHVPFDD